MSQTFQIGDRVVYRPRLGAFHNREGVITNAGDQKNGNDVYSVDILLANGEVDMRWGYADQFALIERAKVAT